MIAECVVEKAGPICAECAPPQDPTPGTVEYDEETELMQEAADAMRN